MGHNGSGKRAERERTVYNGQTPVTDENGNVATVRGTRRDVGRQQRAGIQNTVTPDGYKVVRGRNGSTRIVQGDSRAARQQMNERSRTQRQVSRQNPGFSSLQERNSD